MKKDIKRELANLAKRVEKGTLTDKQYERLVNDLLEIQFEDKTSEIVTQDNEKDD